MIRLFLSVTGTPHRFAIDGDCLARQDVLSDESVVDLAVEAFGIQALEGASKGGLGGRLFAFAA